MSARFVADEQLLKLARRDVSAFGVLYRRHVAWVLRVCVRRTRDPEVAADLTAEVFAAALMGVRRYRPERGSAKNWLLGITLHKLSNLERRGAVERRARRQLGIDAYTLTLRIRPTSRGSSTTQLTAAQCLTCWVDYHLISAP